MKLHEMQMTIVGYKYGEWQIRLYPSSVVEMPYDMGELGLAYFFVLFWIASLRRILGAMGVSGSIKRIR